MRNADLVAAERDRESGVFPKRGIAIVRGRGAEVWDAEGNAYLDMGGVSHGAALVGHCHPRVQAAIAQQSERLLHGVQTYANDARAAFLERLLGIAPGGLDRAFLCNSGTEAVEAAIKFSRGHTGRAGLVAAARAFHGRTMGALSLTHKPEYREPFQPLLPGVRHVRYGDAEALKSAVTRETAALVLEPVQGEGGVVLPPPGYLRAARDACDDAGALLVLDEVQTGLGRTGAMWACLREGIAPDALCFAKGIAGGLPLGGVLLRSGVCTLPPGSHGSTFGGSPLSCAAGSAVLDILREEDLPGRSMELGNRLLSGLQELRSPLVREVRGIGLMVGVELRTRNAPVLEGLLEQGVLGLPTGKTVVRFLPPLVSTPAQIDVLVAAMGKALAGAEAP